MRIFVWVWTTLLGFAEFQKALVTAIPTLSKLKEKKNLTTQLKVYDGDPIILKCNFPKIVGDHDSHAFIWYHDQQSITIGSLVHSPNHKLVNSSDIYKNSYNLQIISTTSNIDTGVYKCYIYQQEEGLLYSVTYNLTVISPIKSMAIDPSRPIANEGSSVTLSCRPKGSSGQIKIFWLLNKPMGWFHISSKDDAAVTTNKSDYLVSTLVISNITQNKRVMCLAQNMETKDKKWLERIVVIKVQRGDVDDEDDDEELRLTVKNVTAIDTGPTHILFRWNTFYVEAFGRPRYTIVYSVLLHGGPKNHHFDCAYSNQCNLTELQPDSSYAIEVFVSTFEWASEPTTSFEFTTIKESDGEENSEEVGETWMTEERKILHSNLSEVMSTEPDISYPDKFNSPDDPDNTFLDFLGNCLAFLGGVVQGIFVVVLTGGLLIGGKILVFYFWHRMQPIVWV